MLRKINSSLSRAATSRACTTSTKPFVHIISRATGRSISYTFPGAAEVLTTAKAQGYVDAQIHEPPSTSIIPDSPLLEVTWSPERQVTSKFHYIWLRDHCRCPKCFHSVTKQRLLNTFEIPRDIEPLNVDATFDGLNVTWHDKHQSYYPWTWLHVNSYNPRMPSAELNPKALWTSDIAECPPTVSYNEVMSDDGDGLLKWLENVDKYGFSFVSGVPVTPEATEVLARRVAFIRETHYGQFWDFTADLAKGDTAYTNLALGAHTDNTYFSDPCGLQLFHLLSHTNGSGGSTLLVDGFQAAEALRRVDEEAFSLLALVSTTAHAAGDPDTLFRATAPLLSLDQYSGEIIRVRYNNDDRSALRSIDPEFVAPWYDALKKWHGILTSKDSEFWVQLQPGTAVLLNNHRVLHGRSAFDGTRRMCGAYLGMDEFHSKLAVLRERFHDPSVNLKGRSVWGSNF